MREVVIIGTGNVATQYCYNFQHHQGSFSFEVYARSSTPVHLENYAITINNDITAINRHADLYLICVNDDAIVHVADLLSRVGISDQAVVAHTSGTKSSALLDMFTNYGVLYPLQTLRKEHPIDFKDVPLLITGNNSKAEKLLMSIAESISDTVSTRSDVYRFKLHLPAVIVNNFVNHLYHMAYAYCKKQDVDFTLLLPLIHETIRKIDGHIDPAKLQTGPAKRDDQLTIQMHLKALKDLDMDSELYVAMTNSIIKTHTT